jgi:IS1 family transposase
MSNTLKTEKQISVIHHLAEGNSIRATSRLCRVHRDTIMRLLNDIGPACKNFMDLSFGNLSLRHLEIDEIWTFCGKKQGTLTEAEKDDPTIGDIYLFIALDEDTKLIPAYVLGKRNRENTEKIADMLAERLVHHPDGHDDVAISTDGFTAYPGAIGNAFGSAVKHGVLIKNYANPESGGMHRQG